MSKPIETAEFVGGFATDVVATDTTSLKEMCDVFTDPSLGVAYGEGEVAAPDSDLVADWEVVAAAEDDAPPSLAACVSDLRSMFCEMSRYESRLTDLLSILQMVERSTTDPSRAPVIQFTVRAASENGLGKVEVDLAAIASLYGGEGSGVIHAMLGPMRYYALQQMQTMMAHVKSRVDESAAALTEWMNAPAP
jgi:hypothetical protein